MARGISETMNESGRSEADRQRDYNFIDKHYTEPKLIKESEAREAAIARFKRPPYYLTGGKKWNL